MIDEVMFVVLVQLGTVVAAWAAWRGLPPALHYLLTGETVRLTEDRIDDDEAARAEGDYTPW